MRACWSSAFLVSLVVLLAACGGDSPNSNPCAGIQAECSTDAECGAGRTCGECGRCETASGTCTADEDCPAGQSCVGGVCKAGGCEDDDDCGEEEVCVAGTCAPFDCSKAGCPDGLRCREADDRCVQCTHDAHCTDGAAPFCELDEGICVTCRQDTDCPGEARCSAERTCVECIENADCSEPTPICKVSAGVCGECNVDADCPDGNPCRDDGTCDLGPEHGEPCTPSGACAPGHVCTGGICSQICDVYEPACPPNTGCALIGNEEGRAIFVGDEPLGACVDDSVGAGLGLPCGNGTACRAGLVCVPVSADGGTCKPLCEPGGEARTCTTGDACVVVELGEDGQEVGLCSEQTTWLAPCVTNADCGAGLGCTPTVEDGALVGRCLFSRGNGAPLTPCDEAADCRANQCIDADGAGFCWGGCARHDDCGADGICLDYTFTLVEGGGTATFPGCRPTCTSNLGCAEYGTDAICSLGVDEARQIHGVCATRRGPGDGGDRCTADADCGTGLCFDNGVPGRAATDGLCMGTCDGDADCGANTQCRDVMLNVGTAAEPVFDSFPLCWGAACSTSATCPDGWACRGDLDPDAAVPEGIRLTCLPAIGPGIGGDPCASNADCETGLCATLNGSQVCWGTCITDGDCANGTFCGFIFLNDTIVSGCLPF